MAELFNKITEAGALLLGLACGAVVGWIGHLIGTLL